MRFFVPTARVLTFAGMLAVWTAAAEARQPLVPASAVEPRASCAARAVRHAAHPAPPACRPAPLKLTFAHGHHEYERSSEPTDEADTAAIQNDSPAAGLDPSPALMPALEPVDMLAAASWRLPDQRPFTPRAPRGPPFR